MAEGVNVEVTPPNVDENATIRLSNTSLEVKFADFHPMLAKVDLIRKQSKYQFRLIKNEWGQAQIMTMLTGIVAFLLGSISGDLFTGGDPKTTGLEGLASLSGFAFFQLILSGILWIWFFVQLSVNFPVMRGHIINVIIIWSSIFLSQVVLHVNSPNFPIGAKLGDALGGAVLTAVGFFFAYFFWKAVTETRDLHVQEKHVHTDVRVMEEAMEEHSLFAWSFIVCTWLFMMLINGWSGAQFIAERVVTSYGMLTLHVISGILTVYLLMHMLWFPQRLLGEGVKVRTRAALSADADLLITGVVLASEGECPSCGESVPISLNDNGETVVDCELDDCNSRGVAGSICEGCDKPYPNRFTCKGCGVNSPVSDYIPDTEAW